MLSFVISGSYTDLYEITMGQAYFREGRKDDNATFDYFFRKLPFQGGYTVFAGLEDLMAILEDLHFSDEDLYFLKGLRLHHDYLDYLKRFRFSGDVFAVREGEIVFPSAPVVRVEGKIIEAQLVESLVLNILNFETLIATKASRIRGVAGDSHLSDFGLRRAHGPGAVLAARAAAIGGFQSTSNVYAAERYGIAATGTMAHSFVESYDEELEAFRAFAHARPEDCVFLVDTYSTLASGVPHAIRVAKEMEARGDRAKAIRLDSGDLAYLSKVARHMLDEAGLPYIKIVASNQLDEYVIKSLLEQGAPIDIFGVGTQLVTGRPDAALDGVYKLSVSGGKPRLKLSEDPKKVSLPGNKQVFRVMSDENEFFGADAVALSGEIKATKIYHPYETGKSLLIGGYRQEPLLEMVMHQGKRCSDVPSLSEIAAYGQKRLAHLPSEYKRFENPHIYKVGISEQLNGIRQQLIEHYQEKKAPINAPPIVCG